MAGTQRSHIIIPNDLLRDIDTLVGPRGRTAFLLDSARQEVRRRKLLAFLESDHPAWNEKDHSEIGKDAGDWVRNLRQQSEGRIESRSRRNRKTK